MKILSIIVPSYNVENYLEKCLDSMVQSNEVLDNCEIIIVNDGSLDRTQEIAERYRENYESVKVIKKENGGHGSAINAGVQEAQGKYFKVLDADDWVVTENFCSFLQKLQESGEDIVAHYQYEIYEDIHETKEKKIASVEPGRHYQMAEIPPDTWLGLSNICFKTEKYREHHTVLDEKCFYVDMEYILYPLQYMEDFIVYDDVVYCYRLGNPNQSVNHQSMYRNKKDHLKVIYHLLDFYNGMINSGAERNLTDYVENKLADLIKAHYYIYFLNFVTIEDIRNLIEFDSNIKQYKRLYNKTNGSKSIHLVRRMHFKCFPFMMRLYRKIIR